MNINESRDDDERLALGLVLGLFFGFPFLVSIVPN